LDFQTWHKDHNKIYIILIELASHHSQSRRQRHFCLVQFWSTYALFQAKEWCKGTQEWDQCHITHSSFSKQPHFFVLSTSISQSKGNILCIPSLPKLAWRSISSSHFEEIYFILGSPIWFRLKKIGWYINFKSYKVLEKVGWGQGSWILCVRNFWFLGCIGTKSSLSP
jgi:hypothetical protein